MGFLALDDRDSIIIYSSGWGQAGSSSEYNTTTTFTDTVGASAKVTFFGSRISVYGTIGPGITGKPVSSYSIDGGSAVNFEGSPTIIGAQYSQLFFQSSVLPEASHTLTITNTGDNASLFLDFLLVTPPATPQITTITTTATPSVVTSARTITVTSTVPGSGSTAGSSVGGAATSSGRSNAGAIAGGIIGAAAFLILLAFGAILYRRRQRGLGGNKGTPYWNSGDNGNPERPLPLAPQFPSYMQPPMSQTTNPGPGYPPFEQWQYSAHEQAAPGGYSAQPVTLNPQASSDLAYYSNDTSEAYGGYEQSPTPPQPLSKSGIPTGRTRVNLNG